MKPCHPVASVTLSLLGACGSPTDLNHPSDSGSPSSLGDTTTIAGQFQPWHHGAGIDLVASIGAHPVARSPIDTTGHFTLQLPGANVVTPWLSVPQTMPSPGCSGGFQVSQPAARYGALSFAAVPSTEPTLQAEAVLAAGENTASRTVAEYLYADQDLAYQGQQTCSATGGSPQTTTQHDLKLKPGWNTAVVSEVFSASTTPLTETVSDQTQALPAELTWQLIGHDGA